MVKISSSKQRKITNDPSILPRMCLWFIFVTMATSYLVLIVVLYSRNIAIGYDNVSTSGDESQLSAPKKTQPKLRVIKDVDTATAAVAAHPINKKDNDIPNANKILPPPPSNNNNNNQQNNQKTCLTSLSQLTPSERHPQKGPRHTVQPPPSSTTLVCCQTTAGGGLPLTIAVHPGWAPRGANRFLSMVDAGWFSTRVPLFRCLKNFLCQFGIPGNNEVKTKELTTNLEDDPNWLPEGPTGRVNEEGVKRFSKGYLAFAGAGKNSRDFQLIMSLHNDRMLGGGSPWEVPWGEVVGETSFEVLDKIFTGYGENGPGQGLLQRKGVTDEVRERWPKLDYITSCEVVDKDW